MMESTRAGVEALRILCDSQKDKSHDVCLVEEDIATENVDVTDNNEEANELGEPEPTISREEAHSTTSFTFKWCESLSLFEIVESSNMRLDTSYFQAELVAQNVEKLLNIRSSLFPKDILKKGDFEAQVHISKTKDKYGLQIILLNDAEMLHRINAELYVEPDEKRESESELSYYIRELSKPLHKTECNITCDDWFTFIDIVEKIKKEYLLTEVGALSKKKIRDLPSFIDTALTCNPHFAYLNDHILLSSPERYEATLLLSSLYYIKEIGGEDQLKMTSFYIWTKGRTKMFHNVRQTYSTVYETKSWPLRLFFGMFNPVVVTHPTIIRNIGTGYLNSLKKEKEDQADINYFLYKSLTTRKHWDFKGAYVEITPIYRIDDL